MCGNVFVPLGDAVCGRKINVFFCLWQIKVMKYCSRGLIGRGVSVCGRGGWTELTAHPRNASVFLTGTNQGESTTTSTSTGTCFTARVWYAAMRRSVAPSRSSLFHPPVTSATTPLSPPPLPSSPPEKRKRCSGINFPEWKVHCNSIVVCFYISFLSAHNNLHT